MSFGGLVFFFCYDFVIFFKWVFWFMWFSVLFFFLLWLEIPGEYVEVLELTLHVKGVDVCLVIKIQSVFITFNCLIC